MNRATTSLRPWFTHRRMVPKWGGLALTGALTFLYPAEARAWLVLLGVALFFPSEYVVHRGVFHYFADKKAGAGRSSTSSITRRPTTSTTSSTTRASA